MGICMRYRGWNSLINLRWCSRCDFRLWWTLLRRDRNLLPCSLCLRFLLTLFLRLLRDLTALRPYSFLLRLGPDSLLLNLRLEEEDEDFEVVEEFFFFLAAASFAFLFLSSSFLFLSSSSIFFRKISSCFRLAISLSEIEGYLCPWLKNSFKW